MFVAMEILDKTLRELYHEVTSWVAQQISALGQPDLAAVPWLETAVLAILGFVALCLLVLMSIALVRLIGHFCFKLDQAAHWLG